MPRVPVEAVVLDTKDTESGEVISKLRELRRKSRCQWSDCAVLYRTHVNRDQLAAEMVRQNIPFTIENMDVMDTPEARDLFACLGAVVSDADGASLFRIAALPQFAIDPEKLRSGIKALPRDAGTSAIALVLSQIEGGGAVLERVRQTRADIAAGSAKGRAAVDILVRNFALNREVTSAESGPRIRERMGEKAITKTGEIGELLDYLEYFQGSRRSDSAFLE